MERTLVIDGLPANVSVPDMANIAEGLGRVDRVVVEHGANGRARSATCWITFHRSQDAARAVGELNGQTVAGQHIEARWSGGQPSTGVS
jgi:hypothetical protein